MAGTATTAHSVLATIGLLRKLCNHPHLLHPERTRGSIEEQEMAKTGGPINASVPPEAMALLRERWVLESILSKLIIGARRGSKAS